MFARGCALVEHLGGITARLVEKIGLGETVGPILFVDEPKVMHVNARPVVTMVLVGGANLEEHSRLPSRARIPDIARCLPKPCRKPSAERRGACSGRTACRRASAFGAFDEQRVKVGQLARLQFGQLTNDVFRRDMVELRCEYRDNFILNFRSTPESFGCSFAFLVPRCAKQTLSFCRHERYNKLKTTAYGVSHKSTTTRH